MIKNYLKIALRNLFKQKTFSFINIFGLALSMSVCLFVITIIKEAYNYDRFHPESERVYRILTDAQRKGGGEEGYASSPFLVAKTLTEDYTFVENWTPLLLSLNGDAKANGKALFGLNGLITDNSFFDLFGFELAAGDPAAALSDPWSMVLTADLAERFFPNGDALGQEIEMPGRGLFKVTGVLKDFPGKTHLEFEMLGSLPTQYALEKMPDNWNITGEWRNYYGAYNYIRLNKGVDPATVEQALQQIAATKFAGLELESRDLGYRFELQALNKITPGRPLSQNMGGGAPEILLWFLSALGVIIMLAAGFNYTNLTYARSLMRTKEVGVRKVLGATRPQIFWQMISEAVVMSLLALGVAYLLFRLAQPVLSRNPLLSQMLDHMAPENGGLYAWFLLFALAVGFLAGFLPAATLSKPSALQVLQKLQNLQLIQKLGLRKALLGFQFTVTLVFIFMLTITGKQLDLAMQKNFGFDKSQTLVVQMQDQDYDKLTAAFERIKGVESISAISHPMGTFRDRKDDVRSDSITEMTGVRDYFVDEHYLDQFDLELAAGEDFPEDLSRQQELFAIVNETFCRQFKLGAPVEAVGKVLTIGDSTRLTVSGVLRDFAYKPANYGIEPLLLRYDPAEYQFLNLRLAGTDLPVTVSALEHAWKQLEPDRDFQGEFFDQMVRRNYEDMQMTSRVTGFFGILGLIIACLGLLGMAMYTVKAKEKEISIRKVMGAGVADLTLLLSKGYFLVLGIAALLALPLSFLLGNMVLQQFAERISWSPLLFLPGILLLALVAGLTIGSQTLRASLGNPVESLRSE